jgi:hypothetical protein
LTDIREWNSVKGSEVWGYRRYRHTKITDRTAAGMTLITSNAEALIFCVDTRKNVGVLQIISAVTNDEETPAKLITIAVLPRLKRRGAGLWETSFALEGDAHTQERLFGVIGLLGFGVYI